MVHLFGFQFYPVLSTGCTIFVVPSLSHVQLFATPWTAAHQASLSFIISWSLLKLMSIESVMPSNHLILSRPLLLLLPSFPASLLGRQKGKGMTEDEMVVWHHRLNGHDFEQAPADNEGQRSLVCCRPWGCKGLDTTRQLNDNNKPWRYFFNSHSLWATLLFPSLIFLKMRKL